MITSGSLREACLFGGKSAISGPARQAWVGRGYLQDKIARLPGNRLYQWAQPLKSLYQSRGFRVTLTILIGSVWVFHGLYSKILDGIPRHRLIVERILGEGIAGPATLAIGIMEILLGVWAFSGRYRRMCALVQTMALVSMNTLEIYLAQDLLISALGMVALNLAFISLIWYWAAGDHRAVR